MFSLLPLATVIDNKVLLVHGGISDKTDLDFLSTVERHKVGLLFIGEACFRSLIIDDKIISV